MVDFVRVFLVFDSFQCGIAQALHKYPLSITAYTATTAFGLNMTESLAQACRPSAIHSLSDAVRGRKQVILIQQHSQTVLDQSGSPSAPPSDASFTRAPNTVRIFVGV